jgi:hypothetical protein
LEKHSDFCIAVDENVHNGIVVKLKKLKIKDLVSLVKEKVTEKGLSYMI